MHAVLCLLPCRSRLCPADLRVASRWKTVSTIVARSLEPHVTRPGTDHFRSTSQVHTLVGICTGSKSFLSCSDSLGTLSPGASTSSWTTPTSQPPTPAKRPPTEMGTMRSYVSPLQRLTTAAERGDTEGVPLLASQLKARTIRLTNIAESAAETLKPNTELAKYVTTVHKLPG